MMKRYVVGPDDWPLWSGRKWWSIYDSTTGQKINLSDKTGGWRVGSERKAQRIADKMNRVEVTITTALDWSRAGAYGPKGYTVRVFVNGALDSVHPCKPWEVVKRRNRLNAEWSGKADKVEANAIPEIPGRRQKGDL